MDDITLTYLKSAEEALLWAEKANQQCFTDNERARVLETLLEEVKGNRQKSGISTSTGRRKLPT